ncbi:hypothetical protein FPV67DRAFT_1649010 [Lyophyllum atratum]|nr:hypothetical protein FPV67DRAFT_1649010 [Lyophyllum atratum]
MAGRLLIAATLFPLALAFSDTVPLLAWSSYPSKTLDRLPSNAGQSHSLLESILFNEDVCSLDAVILVEQEGLHASDLRTLSPSSKLVQILSDSPSQKQFQYLNAQSDSDLAATAEAISTRCGTQHIILTLSSVPGHFTHDSKNVVSIKLPSLASQIGGMRKDTVSLYTSQLADELAYLSTTYPRHLVVYTGSSPLSFAAQHSIRQSPNLDDTPTRPVFDSAYAPINTTLPEGGILKRYQLLTPGLIIVLLITFFILVPIVMMGFKALAGIQSPLRAEVPKGANCKLKVVHYGGHLGNGNSGICSPAITPAMGAAVVVPQILTSANRHVHQEKVFGLYCYLPAAAQHCNALVYSVGIAGCNIVYSISASGYLGSGPTTASTMHALPESHATTAIMFSANSSSDDEDIIRPLSITQLITFVRLASRLKNDIILCQPITISTISAPAILPPTVTDFLADSVGIPTKDVPHHWMQYRDEIWIMGSSHETHEEDEQAFRVHGWKRGLGSLTLYPPSQCCTNANCSRTKPLKKEESRQVVVYTLGTGVRPAWSVHLSCPECRTNYQHNYSVQNGTRTYYPDTPRYVQVGDHQFVEERVIKMWVTMMLVGWFSATNCALSYDKALSQREVNNLEDAGWQFGMSLTTEHVWDAFVIWTLWSDHRKRNIELSVPHTGLQKDRFTVLMDSRNEHVILYGQEEVPHYCNKCMRVFTGPDGELRKCQIIVSDGLTLGHCCCGVFRCTTSLSNNRHRFCPIHHALHETCAIVDCDAPNLPGLKACANKEHQEMERLHFQKGAASFILKERLQRQRVANPNNAVADDQAGPDDLEENIEWFETAGGRVQMHNERNSGSVGVVDNDDEAPCEAVKSPTGNKKVKALFGRRRTHNEQTLVRPCGVIYARATFFGAEAVSNVLIFVKNAFSVPGAYKPEHLIYDTNCDAKQQVLKNNDLWFDGVGMCVDVWHFLNKHKATHEFCQEHCNPADYPELEGENGKWFFNTSIAEQVNVWLGGYHAICREMLPVKYNFFLNEMIRLRNEMVIAKLHADGHNPTHAPPPTS